MSKESIRIQIRGATLAGTLACPAGEGPFGVVVAVHGANEGTRSAPLLRHLAEFLPKHGLAAFVYDRRGEGESTGAAHSAGFQELAADVRAVLDAFASEPSIDPDRMALWAFSQGGWIAPLAVAEGAHVRCLAIISGCGVTPAEQMTHAARSALTEAGYPKSALDRMTEIRHTIDDFYRGRVGRSDADRELVQARAEPWFELAFLPDPSDSADLWALQMDFDVRPALARVEAPVLLVHGERDRWVPLERSIEVWRSSLAGDLTVELISGTGHYPTLADPGDREERGPVAPRYEDALVRWLARHLAA